ncbi:MAG: ferredoxin [bacterium]|nr:ferredoxin [bacterium]
MNKRSTNLGSKAKIPVVDIGTCSLCLGCADVCPSVFKLNEMGYVEVTEMDAYPTDEIDEAIKYCPEDSIEWE